MTLHREPSRRFVSLSFACFALLSLVAGGLVAMPPQAGPPQAKIVGVGADVTDISIQVEWAESIPAGEWVLLDLNDGDGWPVAHQWVLPKPGKTSTLVLPFALEGATSRSPHHVARLVDTAGVELEAYPMQVLLTCDDPAQCAYRVDGGHAAPGMIYLRPAMEAALQEADGAGAQDLLAFVLSQHPELAGDVYSTALQAQRLAQNTDPVSGCSCQWTMSVVEQDSDCDDTCGSTHFVSVERGGIDHPTVSKLVNGTSTMTVDLLCWSASGGGMESATETVFIEGEGETEIEVEGFGPCETECGGSVLYRGTYEVTQGGETQAAGDSVVVIDEATFTVGSGTAFNRQFSFGTGGGLDDVQSGSETQAMTTVPGVAAQMASWADVAVYYTPYLPPFQGGGQTERGGNTAPSSRSLGLSTFGGGGVGNDPPVRAGAHGWSDASYRIEADVQSACTGGVSLQAYTLSSSTTEKQGTDDISILVGKCDDN